MNNVADSASSINHDRAGTIVETKVRNQVTCEIFKGVDDKEWNYKMKVVGLSTSLGTICAEIVERLPFQLNESFKEWSGDRGKKLARSYWKKTKIIRALWWSLWINVFKHFNTKGSLMQHVDLTGQFLAVSRTVINVSRAFRYYSVGDWVKFILLFLIYLKCH